MTETLGFIGLGNMGHLMAGRLLEAGYGLVVHDIAAERVAALVERGATGAASAADVGDRVETVLVSLPLPEHVRQVALGKDGLAEGAKFRTIVDLSTTGSRVAREVAASLAETDRVMLDAPVSGGTAGAAAGTIAVMVSGPKAAFEALKPALDVIGNVFYVSPEQGHGQTMKLINNMLSATAMAASSEMMVMGVKAGLDPRIMLDVVNAGSGRNTATSDKFPNRILPRKFDSGFATGLMVKDIALCLEEAQALGVPTWVAGAVRQLWQYAEMQGGADADFTRIVTHIEQWAGVEVED